MGVTGYKDDLNWRHPLSLIRMLYTFMRLKSKRLETPKKATNPEDDSKPLSSPAFISLNSFLSLHKLSLKSTPRVLVFLIRRNSLQNLFSLHLSLERRKREILIWRIPALRFKDKARAAAAAFSSSKHRSKESAPARPVGATRITRETSSRGAQIILERGVCAPLSRCRAACRLWSPLYTELSASAADCAPPSLHFIKIARVFFADGEMLTPMHFIGSQCNARLLVRPH
jgi:hypothetical protein